MDKHDDPVKLARRASDFRAIDRRSLNVTFVDVRGYQDIVGKRIAYYGKHLLLSNIGRAKLILLKEDPRVLRELSDDDERTLAVHLHEVVINDPLRTGVKESLTDSFVDALLRDMRFGKYPLLMKLQNDYNFDVGSVTVSARPEFSVEKDFAVLLFDEDKHLHGKIGPGNEYGECQISAEIVACAYHNFSEIDNQRAGMDQVVYAIRVIGSRFTFYKASISAEYLGSLSEGLPPEHLEVNVSRFPPQESKETRFGYDYSNETHRPIILEVLSKLRVCLLEV